MAWPKKIELLRRYVEWECKNIPPDLVLAIIKQESGGVPGIVAKVACKCGNVPSVVGDEIEVCNAVGLLQTIPATISFYNQSAQGKDVATIEDMVGHDDRAKRMQIRVGCKYLAYVNHYLFTNYPSACPERSLANADDNQIAIVLTGYNMGNGAIGKKLQQLIDKNISPTWSNIKKYFSDWGKNKNGKWINRPIKYGTDVLNAYRANRSGSYTGSKPSDIIYRAKDTVQNNKGGAIALIFFFAATGFAVNHFFLKRKKNVNT